MKRLGEVFAKLELPLRLGIMSVLSSKKISVLDKQLIQLVQSIEAEQNRMRMRAPRIFREGETVVAVPWIEELKFLIDQLISKPEINLKKVHRKSLVDSINEIQTSPQFVTALEARSKLQKDQNYYFAYRVLQTPTVRLVLPLVRDETCRVIRKFDDRKDYLIRISFTNEKGDKDHYSSEKMHNLVDYQVKGRL